MFLTIKKRLQVLIDTQKKIADGTIRFDPDKKNFGFSRMRQLFSVAKDEVKGFPCLAFNKFSDPVKFGVKVIPSEVKYDAVDHPSDVELGLLREFTTLVTSYMTPHITFYFTDLRVENKKKVMLDFPLKAMRKQIFRESRVLVAEYVNGSSVHEWIQHQPNLTEKQWKYLIFSMAWTLFILQDRYKFLHSDFHYGNVLIDTNIDSSERTFYQYVLKKDDADDHPARFNIQNVGILPKIWDCEFGATFDKDNLWNNKFFQYKQNNVPAYYNPYYDMHCFLISLLELDTYLPDRVRDFIYSVYPEDVLPPKPRYDSDSSSRSSSDSDSDSSDSSSESSSSESSYSSSELRSKRGKMRRRSRKERRCTSTSRSTSSTSRSTSSDSSSSSSSSESSGETYSSCSCCRSLRYYKDDEKSVDEKDVEGTGSIYAPSLSTKSSTNSQRKKRKEEEDCSCSFCWKSEEQEKMDGDDEKSFSSGTSSGTSSVTSSGTSTGTSTGTSKGTSKRSIGSGTGSSRTSRKKDSEQSYCSKSCSCCTEESALNTAYLHDERLINGTERIFKLPTPLDIIMDRYFSDYRVPLTQNADKKKCVFSYTMSGKPYPGDTEEILSQNASGRTK
jgi:hypothetical protein